MLRYFLAVIATIVPRLLFAQSLGEKLDSLIANHPASERAHIALRVVDAESGELIYDHNGSKLFTPASVLKLYTSACALEKLRPNRQFSTEIGISGFITDDTLAGDLVIKAGGDPMLKTEDLRNLALQVREVLHIRQITGSVIVDESLFASPLKGPGWMWDDDPDDYNMSITAMMLDFNVLEVGVLPGAQPGSPARVILKPASAYPPVVNSARTAASTALKITREPFTDTILVSGSIAAGEGLTTKTLTMHDPALWAASVFVEMLGTEGIRVTEGAATSREPVAVDALLIHDGVPLRDAVRRFNKASENAIGEMLLHHLALLEGHHPATWPAGADVISHWLTSTVGLEPGSFRLVDGSGLSRYNRISAESATTLLAYMHGRDMFDVYYDSLPVYPVPLPENSRANADRVHAKPGGMSGVATYAGYLEQLDGDTVVFAYLTNGNIGANTEIRALRDQIFALLVQE